MGVVSGSLRLFAAGVWDPASGKIGDATSSCTLNGNVHVTIRTLQGRPVHFEYPGEVDLPMELMAAQALVVPWEGLRLLMGAHPFRMTPAFHVLEVAELTALLLPLTEALVQMNRALVPIRLPCDPPPSWPVVRRILGRTGVEHGVRQHYHVYWQGAWHEDESANLPEPVVIFSPEWPPAYVQAESPYPPYCSEAPHLDVALGALPAPVRAVTVRLIPERNVEVQMWSDLLAYATLEMLPGFCTQRGVPIAPGRDQMLLWMDSPGTLRPAFPAPIRANPAINCRYVWAHTRDGWRLLSDWARISIQWSPVVTGLLARRPQEALLEEFGPPEVVIFTGPRQRLHDNEPLPRVVSWTQIPVLVQYWRTGEGNEQLVFPPRPELEMDGARH